MVLLLGIDPGPSTGVVWTGRPDDFSAGVDLLTWEGHTIPNSSLQAWLAEVASRRVREAAFRQERIIILVERPPQRSREPAGAARIVQEWLGLVGCEITAQWFGPGQWKPWVKANPLPKQLSRPKTPHERDALCLIWYWLNTKERI